MQFTPDGPEFSEQVLPPGEPPPQYTSRPDGHIELDDDTSVPHALNYSRLFTPSIAPYKRLGIRDRILADARSPQLAISDSPRRPLPVQTDFGQGRQTFVGTMRIRSDGSAVPIPSPSPELLVHQATTDTGVSPRFLVDDSDALFVELPAGDHELRVLVSSPLTYFGGPLPPGRRVQARRSHPVVDALADDILRLAGTSRTQTDVEIVSALARYLHGFTPVDTPEDLPDNDLYMTLAQRREGVCRHRALIFTVTLLSVGVPARYVFNEAHAFAEVQLDNGWRRIELGGAAEALDVLGDTQTDRAFDHPEDELLPPDPMNIESHDASRGGESSSGTDGDGDGDGDDAATSGDNAPAVGPSTQAAQDPTASGQARQSTDEPSTAAPGSTEMGDTTGASSAGHVEDMPGPVSGSPPSPQQNEDAAQPRLPSYLIGVESPSRALRSELLTVEGQLVDDMGNPISFQSVRAFIETGSTRARHEIGEGMTDQSGRFRIEFSLPASLPAGPAELVLRFDGTPLLAPAEFR